MPPGKYDVSVFKNQLEDSVKIAASIDDNTMKTSFRRNNTLRLVENWI